MTDTPTPPSPETAKIRSAARPKVPPFARYRGTSVWRKDRKRARAYALYLAAAKKAETAST
jgi:hypothetical protein